MKGVCVGMRHFSCSRSCLKKIPDNLKNKSKSSQNWLIRQMNDQYVMKAKIENYRARSAFKLIEIDDKYKFLKPGAVVVECGAAPGAWTQVSVNRINGTGKASGIPQGKHISIDLQSMYPVEGAYLLAPMDFTKEATQTAISQLLGDSLVDVVLSDMAPPATGIRELDQDCILKLGFSVLDYAKQVSKNGGSILIKLWAGGKIKQLENELASHYSQVKVVKPASSRQDSAELFLLGRDFKKKT